MGQALIDFVKSWAENLGPWGYAALLAAALIEYIFPPFPGDSVVALGGAWAWGTSQSWLGVWLAVTVGNAVGIGLQHRLGYALAQRTQGRKPGWVLKKLMAWGLTEERVSAMQERIRKHSVALLLLNRFLPSLRALVFLAAGASGLPLKKTLGWGILGSLAWSAFLLGLGAWLGGKVGDNAEEILLWLERYQEVAAWLLGTALVLWLGHALWKRRKAAFSPPKPPSK
ncbi:MAG: VTT domain-containing protein [Cystobacterineae bacterium]|nr:VTT domain-containing protein [Cystobacterineae bacterium]